MDAPEPTIMKSKTDKVLPNRENPYTERADPNRTKFLVDKELPKMERSSNDN
jgi:hypothetical protein